MLVKKSLGHSLACVLNPCSVAALMLSLRDIEGPLTLLSPPGHGPSIGISQGLNVLQESRGLG